MFTHGYALARDDGPRARASLEREGEAREDGAPASLRRAVHDPRHLEAGEVLVERVVARAASASSENSRSTIRRAPPRPSGARSARRRGGPRGAARARRARRAARGSRSRRRARSPGVPPTAVATTGQPRRHRPRGWRSRSPRRGSPTPRSRRARGWPAVAPVAEEVAAVRDPELAGAAARGAGAARRRPTRTSARLGAGRGRPPSSARRRSSGPSPDGACSRRSTTSPGSGAGSLGRRARRRASSSATSTPFRTHDDAVRLDALADGEVADAERVHEHAVRAPRRERERAGGGSRAGGGARSTRVTTNGTPRERGRRACRGRSCRGPARARARSAPRGRSARRAPPASGVRPEHPGRRRRRRRGGRRSSARSARCSPSSCSTATTGSKRLRSIVRTWRTVCRSCPPRRKRFWKTRTFTGRATPPPPAPRAPRASARARIDGERRSRTGSRGTRTASTRSPSPSRGSPRARAKTARASSPTSGSRPARQSCARSRRDEGAKNAKAMTPRSPTISRRTLCAT